MRRPVKSPVMIRYYQLKYTYIPTVIRMIMVDILYNETELKYYIVFSVSIFKQCAVPLENV